MGFNYNFDRDEPRIIIPRTKRRRSWIFAVIFTAVMLLGIVIFRPTDGRTNGNEEGTEPGNPGSGTTAERDTAVSAGLNYTPEQQALMKNAEESAHGGNLLKARSDAMALVNTCKAGGAEWIAAGELLGRINMKILTQPVAGWKNQEYVVRSGDSFNAISNKFNTTNELLWKVNKLPENSSNLRVGDKLTVCKAEWAIVLRKKDQVLCVYDGPELFKVYKVGLSAQNQMPSGEYTLPGSLKKKFSAGADRNMNYGTRMMGLKPSTGGAVHGSWAENVRGSFKEGYARMSNSDIEEIFMYIPGGTKIKITE